MTARSGKRGQVAIFLVLILAGLALLFALNVDVFTSSRAKIRLQNAADASAIALARWQGITLNMIGELNLAHLAAVSHSNETAIAGIVALQQRLAYIGPTIGFKAANDAAKANGIEISSDMTRIPQLVSELMDEDYRRMLEVVFHNGIRAGVDNAAFGNFPNKDLIDAILNNDFRFLCKYGGGKHQLPDIDFEVPALAFPNSASFGCIGIDWERGTYYEGSIGTLADIARDCGVDAVTEAGLKTNSVLLARWPWCIYDNGEWHGLPDAFSFARFPWLTPLREEYNVSGGCSTIRVEGSVALSSLTATTNFIVAKAAAKAFGSVGGRRVIDISPSIVLPCFSRVRLIPLGVVAFKRANMADLEYVDDFLPPSSGGSSKNDAQKAEAKYNSDGFRAAAEAWYSQHGHNDADGCYPPGRGTERGGGTPYGI